MSVQKLAAGKSVDLKQYTTIKIGGLARSFFVAQSQQEVCQLSRDFGPRLHVLGAGSNILVREGEFLEPVIKLGEAFSYIHDAGGWVEVGGATRLSRILHFCLTGNRGGLASLAGIPATLGGLLCMNAASFGQSIGSVVSEVSVVDASGTVRCFPRESINFGYRRSSLEGAIIVSARLKFYVDSGVRQQINYFLKKRLSTQDLASPSCGCIFKNPSQHNAGFLIDSCGLKGMSKGGAKISPKHANFIVNVHHATYDDVDYLIQTIKETVFKKYNILLDEEIRRWP